MNKAEIIFDAITDVRPELVEEAQNYRFRRRSKAVGYGPWLALAACLVIAAGLGWRGLWSVANRDDMGSDSNNSASGEQSVQEPEGMPQAPSQPGMSYGDGGAADDETPAGSETAVRVEVLVLWVREDGLVAEVLAGDESLLSQTVLLPAESITAAVDIATGDTLAVAWSGEIDWEAEPPTLLGELTVEPVQP